MKTLLDIHLSASAAAAANVTLAQNSLALEQAKLLGFTEAEGNAADYPEWSQRFDQLHGNYQALQKNPSPSAQAAATAAAVK